MFTSPCPSLSLGMPHNCLPHTLPCLPALPLLCPLYIATLQLSSTCLPFYLPLHITLVGPVLPCSLAFTFPPHPLPLSSSATILPPTHHHLPIPSCHCLTLPMPALPFLGCLEEWRRMEVEPVGDPAPLPPCLFCSAVSLPCVFSHSRHALQFSLFPRLPFQEGGGDLPVSLTHHYSSLPPLSQEEGGRRRRKEEGGRRRKGEEEGGQRGGTVCRSCLPFPFSTSQNLPVS